jgi:hypothetical protein
MKLSSSPPLKIAATTPCLLVNGLISYTTRWQGMPNHRPRIDDNGMSNGRFHMLGGNLRVPQLRPCQGRILETLGEDPKTASTGTLDRTGDSPTHRPANSILVGPPSSGISECATASCSVGRRLASCIGFGHRATSSFAWNPRWKSPDCCMRGGKYYKPRCQGKKNIGRNKQTKQPIELESLPPQAGNQPDLSEPPPATTASITSGLSDSGTFCGNAQVVKLIRGLDLSKKRKKAILI